VPKEDLIGDPLKGIILKIKNILGELREWE